MAAGSQAGLGHTTRLDGSVMALRRERAGLARAETEIITGSQSSKEMRPTTSAISHLSSKKSETRLTFSSSYVLQLLPYTATNDPILLPLGTNIRG